MNAQGRDGAGYFFHRYFHTRLHTHSHLDWRSLTHPGWDQKHWPTCCLVVTSFIISHFCISAPAFSQSHVWRGGRGSPECSQTEVKVVSCSHDLFSFSFQGHSLSGWGWSQKSCHILVRQWHCGASFQNRARPSSLRYEINFHTSRQYTKPPVVFVF